MVVLALLFVPVDVMADELRITDLKVEPGTVTSGGQVLISCRVNHPEGIASIERVAATVFRRDPNTTYPMVYDDGTHGDTVANDGIYSLEITVDDTPDENEIVFTAVDMNRNAIESEPVILTVR